jgi:hypothetical protein
LFFSLSLRTQSLLLAGLNRGVERGGVLKRLATNLKKKKNPQITKN